MGLTDFKIHVSYFMFGTYVAGVFLLSVVLSVIISLADVKRSDCDVPVATALVKNVENLIKDDKIINEKFYENLNELQNHQHNHPAFRNSLRETPTCPELFSYNPDKWPWENIRLPLTVIPNRYELEFYRPYFPQKIYNGEVAIYVDLTVNSTDTFLVHSAFLNVIYPFIYDNQNKTIAIKCADYYPLYDYFIIRTTNPVLQSQSPLQIKLYFNGFLDKFESGLFLVDYDLNPDDFNGNLMTSHFEPLDARKAFPCFDEPSFKAVFSITINHPNYTIAASNMQPINEATNLDRNGTLRTKFQDTPRLPPYLIGITVFNSNDFSVVSRTSISGKKINVWALKRHVDGGYADGPADLALDIFNAIEYYLYPFPGLNNSGPAVINMVALPEYPDDAVPHWGLPLFRETRLLFKSSTVTEQSKQTIALLIAKQFAEFWFGNYVTFKWWDDLWLQEGVGDYLKYKFVDFAYQDWRINEQFITEELINVLVNDAYPSSHPVVKPINYYYDIEQLFDEVGTSKVAAILRMIEYEVGEMQMWNALASYITHFAEGTGLPDYLFQQLGTIRNKWAVKDFVGRWFLQVNYPLVEISVNYDTIKNQTSVSINQSRFLNTKSSIFGLDSLYPSPFGFIWYIPLKCRFGKSVNDVMPYFKTFEVENKTQTEYLPGEYNWVHCDEFFTGYYTLDYTSDNWNYLAQILRTTNSFEPAERSNIIHNIFVNAFAQKERYFDLVNVISYLRNEVDYLPWKTVNKHVKDIVDILDYRPSFLAVSNWFQFELRVIEQNIDLWGVTTNHVEQLTKSTILELSCRLQDFYCLNKSSSYWNTIYYSFIDPSSNNTVPIHVRPIVYNYHFQNTYSIRDWDIAFLRYETIDDTQEQERLLEALTFTRLPSNLARFWESQRKGGLKLIDFLDATKFFASTPLGRELVWNYYRANYENLINQYSIDAPIIGQLLIEICRTFEDEFLLNELIRFVIYTPSGASQNARFKALETVSITISWLTAREKEIEQAFNPRGFTRQSFNKIFLERQEAQKFTSNLITNENVLLEKIKAYASQLQKEKQNVV